jgi:acetyl-CoA synthetase
VVRAVLVLRTEARPSPGDLEAEDALRADIQRHCREVTAPYKYPRIVEFTDELPKTSSGKIRRSELRRGPGPD